MSNRSIDEGQAFVRDLGERVVSTFLEIFIPMVFVVGGAVRVGWGTAAATAGFGAATAFLTTVLAWYGALKALKNPYVDLAYRSAVTFVQTLVGYMLAATTSTLLTFDWDTALKASIGAAGVALTKGLIGLNSPTFAASTLVHFPQLNTKHPHGSLARAA